MPHVKGWALTVSRNNKLNADEAPDGNFAFAYVMKKMSQKYQQLSWPPPPTDDPAENKEYKAEGVSKTVRKELSTQVTNETTRPEMHETGTTGTQNETTFIAAEEQPVAEPEDKTVTQATKKAKYE